MAYDSNNEKGNVFGVNLRARVSATMKTAALANGVFDNRIDTHSLRAGGATALYTQGVPSDVIQRWGRWKSLTFHQYLWHDATALNHLSEVIVQSSGLLDCLRLMNKTVPKVRFQDISTMGGKTRKPMTRTRCRRTFSCQMNGAMLVDIIWTNRMPLRFLPQICLLIPHLQRTLCTEQGC